MSLFLEHLSSTILRASRRRSPHWEAFERSIIAAHGQCAACPNRSHLQAHHILPFHLHPDLELVESNVIVLCEAPGMNCHLRVGHGGNFSAYNPNVLADAALAALAGGMAHETAIAQARAARLFA